MSKNIGDRKEILKEILKDRLSSKRYIHTLGVEKMAVSLAKRHGADVEKASLASLFHDYAKNMSGAELLYEAERRQIFIDSVSRQAPTLLHGPVAAELVRERFNIEDENILNAIRYHTYGRMEMTLLERIVYVADAVESGREYEGAEALRTLALFDLDKAFERVVADALCHVIRKGQTIHTNTVVLWNAIVMKKEHER